MARGSTERKQAAVDSTQRRRDVGGDTTSAHDRPAAGARFRRRSRQSTGRVRSVRFGLTDQEYGELDTAAAQAGLAKGAYAAMATLAAARGLMNPADSPFRQALTELIRAAGLVRRIGVNLNQAVAKLNATGQRSADLVPYAAERMRRADRLDAAAEAVRRRLR